MNATVTTARERGGEGRGRERGEGGKEGEGRGREGGRGGEGGKEGERGEKENSEEVFPIGVWEEGVPQHSVQTRSNDRIHHFLQKYWSNQN